MQRQKHSVFLKFLLALSIIYPLYSAGFYLYDQFVYLNLGEYKQNKTNKLTAQLRFGRLYLQMGDLNGLKAALDDAVKNHDADFYLLGKNGSFWQKNTEEVPPNFWKNAKKNEITLYEDIEIAHLSSENGDLYLGNYLSPKHGIFQTLDNIKGKIFGDLLFFFTYLSLLLAYFFQDIIQLARNLRNGNRSALLKMNSDSEEAELMVNAFGGYEKTLQRSTQQSEVYAGQILPSIQHELSSGVEPPYEFSCVMVRTDINQFSTIFNQYPRGPWMEMINEFFGEVAEIIARYQGLVHEYAGDEVIFYFKDKGGLDPHLLAAGAVRDIQKSAEAFHARATKDHGYPFVVKSSMAAGVLRFGRLVHGFTTAGAPFIETVRILSEIHDKENNTFYFPESAALRLRGVCETQFQKVVRLKGYQTESSLYSYERHERFSNFFTVETAPYLVYFRREEELRETILWLGREARELDSALFLQITKGLAGSDYSSLDLQEAITFSLEAFFSQRYPKDEYRLSALLSLVRSIVSVADFGDRLERVFLACLKYGDRRVSANAIDLLSYYKPEKAYEFFTGVGPHSDHRIYAGALVKEAYVSLSDPLVKKLERMLQATNAVQVASALYAAGQIAAYYQKRDPIYLSTRVRFLRLLEALPKYATHENTMVLRQALVAAKKWGDEALLQELRKTWEEGTNAKLEEYCAELFGWHKVSVEKRHAA